LLLIVGPQSLAKIDRKFPKSGLSQREIAVKTNQRFQQFMSKNYKKNPADFHGSAFFNLKAPTKMIANCH
jgi:hypothetical protein